MLVSYPLTPLLVGRRLPVCLTARSTGTVGARNAGEERGVLNVGGDVIRVAIADDQRLFARGIAGIVDEQPDMQAVGQAHDGEEAVELCRREEPDVVLMDISMPKMDGISATRELRDLLPGAATLILTSSEEDEHVSRA